MPPYRVCCYRPGCDNLAVYKIAARWTDGLTEELKTYSLTCKNCVDDLFRESRERQARCRLSGNESLDVPGIFALTRGKRDRRLKRMTDLEKQLA